MHEVERLSDGIAIQAHNRSIGEESPHRGCEAGTDYGAERSRNPFLEETYTLKAKDELVWCSWNGESHNLISSLRLSAGEGLPAFSCGVYRSRDR